MKRYFGVFVVFLVAAVLFSMNFSNLAEQLNKKYAKTELDQSNAYSVIRSFIVTANKKDPNELEKCVSKRGLDLGFDILLDPEIKLVEVVGVPHVAEREVSAIVLAFDESKNQFKHFALYFIKEEEDKEDTNWLLYGFFRQPENEH